MDNIEYVAIRGGCADKVAVLAAEYTDELCRRYNIGDDERGDYIYIRDYDCTDKGASNYYLESCWTVLPKPSAQAARENAEIVARKKALIAEFRDPKGKALRLRPLHGRDSPTEDMDEMGPSGPCIYFDWIHTTYMSDCMFGTKNNAGEKVEHFYPNVSAIIRFEKDLLVIDDGVKIQYYGDWEIDANEEA